MKQIELLRDREIYEKVIQGAVPLAQKFVWIATADIKDLYVNEGRKMVPFLKVLDRLLEEGVNVRIIHAKEPGGIFLREFDRFPFLIKNLERMLCPRMHFKAVAVDGILAYTGSANLTGAGMGAKSPARRNFELGIITTDKELIGEIMQEFDSVWNGSRCAKCGRKQYCPDPID